MQTLRSIRSRTLLASALLLALAAAMPAAHAQDRGVDERGPRAESRLPELTLQAQAVSEVVQDTVTLTLAVEIEGADQASVGKKLTAALNESMAQVKGDKDVKARNGAYRIWANTNRDGKVTGWHGRVELLLESKNFEAASTLASKVSARMPIAGIGFSLSEEARAQEEKRLLTEAANAFRERALSAATAFGFKGYRIRKLDLSGSGAQYVVAARPRAAMMASASLSKEADVSLEADTVTVTVSVNGTVFLQ